MRSRLVHVVPALTWLSIAYHPLLDDSRLPASQDQQWLWMVGCLLFFFRSTVLVKNFAHLNKNFFLASLEERDKHWKWLTVNSGVLQLANFWWMNISNGFWVIPVRIGHDPGSLTLVQGHHKKSRIYSCIVFIVSFWEEFITQSRKS